MVESEAGHLIQPMRLFFPAQLPISGRRLVAPLVHRLLRRSFLFAGRRLVAPLVHRLPRRRTPQSLHIWRLQPYRGSDVLSRREYEWLSLRQLI
jgi:hypothetical protein